MELTGRGSIIDPLLAIEREDRTGVLEFRAEGVTTAVHARSGEVAYADLGTVAETLGRVLIRSGWLTEEQVSAIIRRMTDALVDDEPLRFGNVVIDYGFMNADDLEQALTQQVKEKLMGCVHRGAGEWTFTPDDPRLDEVGSYVVRTRPVLIEAAIDLPERRMERVLLLDEERYPEIVAPQAIVAAEFELDDVEARVLDLLDGTRSLHALLASDASIASLVVALVLGGGIELKPRPSGPRTEARPIPSDFRTQRRAHFSAPDPTEPHLRASIFQADGDRDSATITAHVPLPAPERRSSRGNLEPPRPIERKRAQDALGRLNVDLAKRKPENDKKRWPEPKDEKARRLMAESAFHQGRLFLREDEASRALPGLSRAHELRSEEPEYELYVKWSRMLVNDEFKHDSSRAEIQRLAAKLVRESRECELAYAILGRCALHDGNDDAALRFFARAVQLDPKLVEATRHVRSLSARAARPTATSPAARRAARGRLVTPLDEIVPSFLQNVVDGFRSEEPPVPSAVETRREPLPTDPTTPTAAPPVPRPPQNATETAQMRPVVMPPTPPPVPRTPPPVPVRSPTPPPAAFAPAPRSPTPPTATSTAQMPSAGLPPEPRPYHYSQGMPFGSDPSIGPHARSVPFGQNRSDPPAAHGAGEPSTGPHVPSLPFGLGPTDPLTGPRLPSAPSYGSAPGPVVTASPRPRSALVWILMIGLVVIVGVAVQHSFRQRHAAKPAVAATALPVVATATAEASATPSPSVASTPSAVVDSLPNAEPATTGTLHAVHGRGHRVYIDGHNAGDGAKDFVLACGPHRVKVGSSGVERAIVVPCGGTIEVD